MDWEGGGGVIYGFEVLLVVLISYHIILYLGEVVVGRGRECLVWEW